jgi:hypothetical protein
LETSNEQQELAKTTCNKRSLNAPGAPTTSARGTRRGSGNDSDTIVGSIARKRAQKEDEGDDDDVDDDDDDDDNDDDDDDDDDNVDDVDCGEGGGEATGAHGVGAARILCSPKQKQGTRGAPARIARRTKPVW